jgi:hypothetical protein
MMLILIFIDNSTNITFMVIVILVFVSTKIGVIVCDAIRNNVRIK